MSTLGFVVPIGPGERHGPALLQQLRELASDCPVAIVYAAGDPQPHWPANGLECCLQAPAGRAAQQNAGAAILDVDYLCFVHADSSLDAQALAALRRFVAASPRALGYFDLAFSDGPRLMALTACAVRWRCRWLGLPFGDQGLCLPRAEFLALGGFDEDVAVGEDHALVWAARRAGLRAQPMGATLRSSARKYIQHGWWRTTWRHQCWTWAQVWREWRA